MPNESELKVEPEPRGAVVSVSAKAGARQNGILGIRNGALRVAVTAAPEKGKANRAIVDVLSKALNISKSSIELVSGAGSPQKRFVIVGADPGEVRRSLGKLLSDAETNEGV